MCADIIYLPFYASLHPIETAQILYGYTWPAVDAFFRSLQLSWWIKDPAGGTEAKGVAT